MHSPIAPGVRPQAPALAPCAVLTPERCTPTAAAAPAELVQAFLGAMRRFASSVTIVTARDEAGRPHGMAASAVISVSMEPPALLVAIHRDASLHPVVSRTRRFAVNLLGAAQQAEVTPFASSARRAERFAGPGWSRDDARLPHLASAEAAVFCEVDRTLDYGTHTLFVGRVAEVLAPHSARGPLVWLDGAHGAVHRPGSQAA